MLLSFPFFRLTICCLLVTLSLVLTGCHEEDPISASAAQRKKREKEWSEIQEKAKQAGELRKKIENMQSPKTKPAEKKDLQLVLEDFLEQIKLIEETLQANLAQTEKLVSHNNKTTYAFETLKKKGLLQLKRDERHAVETFPSAFFRVRYHVYHYAYAQGRLLGNYSYQTGVSPMQNFRQFCGRHCSDSQRKHFGRETARQYRRQALQKLKTQTNDRARILQQTNAILYKQQKPVRQQLLQNMLQQLRRKGKILQNLDRLSATLKSGLTSPQLDCQMVLPYPTQKGMTRLLRSVEGPDTVSRYLKDTRNIFSKILTHERCPADKVITWYLRWSNFMPAGSAKN